MLLDYLQVGVEIALELGWRRVFIVARLLLWIEGLKKDVGSLRLGGPSPVPLLVRHSFTTSRVDMVQEVNVVL